MKDIFNISQLKESIYYEKSEGKELFCGVCERRCRIKEGDSGFCNSRINIDGKLYTIYYGEISALESRPIEIKPFFHFFPNSSALTYSTWSCNFKCPWCQNNSLSMVSPRPRNFISPYQIIEEALKRGDRGICVSFNEPILLLEHCIDTFRLAKQRNLYTCIVSNGYMSLKSLDALASSGLDGIRFDIKGDEKVYKDYLNGAKVDIIWRNAKHALNLNIHVEMINLIIPKVNDNEETIKDLVEIHLKELGAEVPIHFTRYYPAYKFKISPTSISTLEKAYEIAKSKGILYPYLGNVPGHAYENTYCPDCGSLLIERFGYRISKINLRGKSCYKCQKNIPIYGSI